MQEPTDVRVYLNLGVKKNCGWWGWGKAPPPTYACTEVAICPLTDVIYWIYSILFTFQAEV